jgi:hypothetical protein
MSASHMRAEDRLVGASNWSPWKARIIFILEDIELWDIVEAHVTVPPANAPILLAKFRKRNNKAKRTIVTRWDILLRNVQLEEKNTRRETRGTMPTQLNMKSHPQR